MSSSTIILRRIAPGSVLYTLKLLPKSPLARCNFTTLCSRKLEPYVLIQKPIAMRLVGVKWYGATTNDLPDYKKHSHSQIWVMERLTSIGLLLALPGLFTTVPAENVECLASVFVALHVHWGLEAVFTDYLRPTIVGNIIPKFCDIYAGMVSVLLAALLLWVSIYGNGVVKTAKQLWFLDETLDVIQE